MACSVNYNVVFDINFFTNKVRDCFIDYKKIINGKYSLLKNKEAFSIIINSPHSLKILEKSIPFINFSLEKANLRASITVIQNNETPTHRDFCLKHGLNYIFIPYEKNNFPKNSDALCYNVGVLSNLWSDFFMVQRSDILIPHDFFTNYKFTDQNFFNNYTTNSINCINKPGVELLLTRPGLYNLYQLKHVENKFTNCGISISFSKKTFFDVGGFDVELKTAKQNTMFRLFEEKIKALKLVNNKKNYNLNIFKLSPQDIFQYTIEEEIQHQFINLTLTEKKQYISTKQQHLRSVVEKLQSKNKIDR